MVGTRFSVTKCFGREKEFSQKDRMILRMFGVDSKRLKNYAINHSLDIEVRAGDIVYVTGPSGSGKSVLLNELKKTIEPDQRMDMADVEIVRDRSVVDCFGCELVATLGILNRAGLNDIYCYLS
ncbi:MAG TPA: ATP-binding cassette domain-containing protein, partial [Patescibacteria group bacterium]|nr:ATP-binding cassette domain-containing protein [Patescibacteria group bacterium]